MKLTYEQVNDVLHAYALGALEADEMHAVDEYFDRQQALIDRLSQIEAATTLLAIGSEPVSVNTDTQKLLMDRVQADLPHLPDHSRADHEPAQHVQVDPNASMYAPDYIDYDGETIVDLKAASSPLANGKIGQSELTSADGAEGHGTQPRMYPDHPDELVDYGQAQPKPRPMPHRGIPTSAMPKGGLKHRQHAAEKPRRRFFSRAGLTSAALAASVAGLLFLGFLNVRGEQQYNALLAESEGLRATLAEAEAQIGAETERMASLRTDYQNAISENEALASQQSELTTANEELIEKLAKSEEIQNAQNIRNLQLFAQKSQVESQLEEFENQTSEYASRLGIVGAANQATIMFGTEEAPGLQGTFFHASEEGELVIHGLKPLPEEQTYQFWLVTESGEQVSAGTFGIQENQEPTWVNLNLPQNLPQYTIAGITIEPASGSDEPTGPMLLESSISGDEAGEPLS